MDIDDKILKAVSGRFKTVNEISEELGEDRRKVQMHLFKMRKWGDIIRIKSTEAEANGARRIGEKGWKYRKADRKFRSRIMAMPAKWEMSQKLGI